MAIEGSGVASTGQFLKRHPNELKFGMFSCFDFRNNVPKIKFPSEAFNDEKISEYQI